MATQPDKEPLDLVLRLNAKPDYLENKGGLTIYGWLEECRQNREFKKKIVKSSTAFTSIGRSSLESFTAQELKRKTGAFIADNLAKINDPVNASDFLFARNVGDASRALGYSQKVKDNIPDHLDHLIRPIGQLISRTISVSAALTAGELYSLNQHLYAERLEDLVISDPAQAITKLTLEHNQLVASFGTSQIMQQIMQQEAKAAWSRPDYWRDWQDYRREDKHTILLHTTPKTDRQQHKQDSEKSRDTSEEKLIIKLDEQQRTIDIYAQHLGVIRMLNESDDDFSLRVQARISELAGKHAGNGENIEPNNSQPRKRLIELKRETTESLLLIYDVCKHYRVEYLDQLPAIKAWGNVISGDYPNKNKFIMEISEARTSITLNGG